MALNVTLSDIYIKLEEIEERLERLEAIMARPRASLPPAQQVQAPRPALPYNYVQNSKPAPPAVRRKEEQKPQNPEKSIDIKNWRYLLGLE